MGHVYPSFKKRHKKIKNGMKESRNEKRIQNYLTQMQQKLAERKSTLKKLAY